MSQDGKAVPLLAQRPLQSWALCLPRCRDLLPQVTVFPMRLRHMSARAATHRPARPWTVSVIQRHLKHGEYFSSAPPPLWMHLTFSERQ